LNSDTNMVIPSIETIYSKKLEFQKRELFPKSVPDEYLAIVLFTSGSTGKPKGVPLTRANMAAFVKAFWDIGYSIDHNDRFLQISDLSFDGSIISFLFPAIIGACAYTVPQNHMKQIYIAELLSMHSLTVAFMVPSTIRYYKPYFDEIKLPSLRYNIFAGEALPLDLVNEWSRCVPNAIIDNAYGPAENTVICSWYRYNRDGENKSYNGVMSIGKSMTGGLMIVTDDENEEIAEYQKGELCLSGSQLTPGYLNNPERNKEVFFIDKQGRRFYRTGDICFKDSDGDVMFCGRADSQIKVQGIRIELGEIEFYAHEILEGQNVVAVEFENKTGNTEIALIVEGELKDIQLVSKQLISKMPQYMVPTKILCNPKFPLNANGKTDRLALKNWLTRQNE
jgi:D-alanine--poly(phosphoribitol) ligase subunit 1